MKKLFLIMSAAVVLSGCNLLSGKPADEPDETDSMVVEESVVDDEDGMMEKVVTLSEQNDSGQSGTATLSWTDDGKLWVKLDLSGGDYTDPQPAHVHTGSCPTPGGVKYPLTNVVNGVSKTTVDVDADTWESEVATGLAINVHKSADEVSVYTACGNVQ